ncbi:MAG: endonuclease [Gemmatimonadota bacterium]
MRISIPWRAFAVALIALLPLQAQSSILISELCDPRLNYTTDRFIEIYNSGTGAVDLTGWSLVAVGNGGDIFTWNLSGDIEPGDALVAGDATTVIAFTVDFPDEAWSSNNGLWNGKVGDGAKLLDDGSAIVDYVVVDATRFENKDYVRNYGVTEPNTSYDPSEWTATSVDYPTQGSPGTHDSEPPPPAPEFGAIDMYPENPMPGEGVDVQAVVTDTAATITSVVLSWGLLSTSLPNEIVMSVLYGNVYETDTPIPGQAEGVTVYFEITATNDVPASATSELHSYTTPVTVSIHAIQGEVAASPYDGLPVITHGVVTAQNALYFVIQDGGGPWNGLWARGLAVPVVGDSVTVFGTVTESDGINAGNTFLAGAVVQSSVPAAAPPGATLVTTAEAPSEPYEGVLVRVENADCTNANVGAGVWLADDGSGSCAVGEFAYDSEPTLGTTYDVTGPVGYSGSFFKIEPRDAGDIVWVGDSSAPVVTRAAPTSDTVLMVTFSEEVEQISAGTVGNYAIDSLSVLSASPVPDCPDQVELTVSAMWERTYTLTVDGVEDLFGNATVAAVILFDYVDYSAPEGYYDSAEGLLGEPLRAALHVIIDDHTVLSYDYAWTAFRTTDDKPNGKVWDIYSDVPGGTPPYEYDFGVDEGGIGGAEGNGYTREHSWPQSWFDGASPMVSDLFALYPCDAHVNGNRGHYPYGEVTSPEWVSLNGSERGPCSYPGYSGLAFEPIDEYKGDLARTYFYMTARYYTEDAGWTGSPMADGADLLPWARDMLLEWHAADPVSQKETERNGTIYGMQHNRNPFIDRPEFAVAMYVTTGIDEEPAPVFRLCRNVPNPFNPTTTIRFEIPRERGVRVEVYDVSGRLVKVLADCDYPAGEHEVSWGGRDADGNEVASGVYFCRMTCGEFEAGRKMVLLK